MRSTSGRESLPSQFAGHRWRLVLIASLATGAALCEAAALVILVALASSITSGEEFYRGSLGPMAPSVVASVPRLLLVASAVMALRAALFAVSISSSAHLVAAWEAQRRRELFDAYTRSSWSAQSEERAGELQDLITDQVRHGGQALHALTAGATAATSFAVMVAGAVLLNPLAAFAVFGVGAVLSLVIRPFSRRIRSHSARYRNAQLDVAHVVSESVSLAREIRIFGASVAVRDRFAAEVRTMSRQRRMMLRLQAMLPVAYQTVAFFLLIGALGALYFLEPGNVAAVGGLVLLVYRGLNYSQAVQSAFDTLNEHRPYIASVTAAVGGYDAEAQEFGACPLGGVDSIAVENLGYTYDGRTFALRGVSFAARRGDVIGVVGPSGSGKSTLVQLLLRMRAPTTGKVLINGVDASEFSEESWAEHVSAVPQEPLLLSGSVEENIRFFRGAISSSDVVDAAGDAHVRREIELLPEGFASAVGDLGGRVSGGQRQRMCIARALAGRPDVIAFDEPTSSLDVHSESLIQSTLEELQGNRILFIVAHRLSTLDICTKVLVLRDGELDAFGARDELEIDNAYFADALRLSGLSGRSREPLHPGGR